MTTELISQTESSLKAGTPAYSPGLEGVIAGVTQISKVDSERQSLMYRGYDIKELTEKSDFEESAYLLLFGELPTQKELQEFKNTLIQERTLPEGVLAALKQFPKGSDLMDALKAGTAVMSLFDADAKDQSPEATQRKALRLIAKTPALIAYSYHYTRGTEPVASGDASMSHAANFLYMITGKKPSEVMTKAFDTSLIAYLEHGFNASTFASRVTTSTKSDIYSAIVSGIGTLKGPLHGGANEEAMKMLLEIESPEKAEAWVRDALATKKKIMGFGHREYKIGDPRAKILTQLGKKMAEEMQQTHWTKIADIVENIMVSEKSIHPNVDFPTAYIYYMMELPIEIYTPIFALARVVGWSAHVLEQQANNRLIRPKALYEGHAFRPFQPVSERG